MHFSIYFAQQWSNAINDKAMEHIKYTFLVILEDIGKLWWAQGDYVLPRSPIFSARLRFIFIWYIPYLVLGFYDGIGLYCFLVKLLKLHQFFFFLFRKFVFSFLSDLPAIKSSTCSLAHWRLFIFTAKLGLAIRWWRLKTSLTMTALFMQVLK